MTPVEENQNSMFDGSNLTGQKKDEQCYYDE